MRPLRCILAFGLCALFLFGTSLKAQDLVPEVITSDLNLDTTYAQYPIYFVVGANGHYGSSLPYTYLSNVNFYHLKNDASTDWPEVRVAQFWRAFCENQGFDYCPLSDIVTSYKYNFGLSQVYNPSNELIVEAGGRTVSMSHFGSTETRNISSFFVLVSLRGVVYYRNTDSQNEYDVFYYLYLAPANSNGVGVASWYCYANNSFRDYSFIPTSNMISLDRMYTYQFCGQFRARITGTDFELVDQDDQISLPFYKSLTDSNIVFCKGLGNFYWNSFGTVDKDSTDYPGFTSYNFSSSVANTANWPFYIRLKFETANFSYFLDEFTTFPNLAALDSDGGGMSDFEEWYQTKHDLLDPDDDTENTEEIDDEKPLPEPEEGESVVDIGKDTVDRYKRYWDEAIGTDEELGEVTLPELDDPDELSINPPQFEYIYHEADNAWKAGFDDNSKFKTTLDSTFSTLNNADTLNWQFNPSIQSNLVSVALPPVSISPSEWIRDPVYGPYFTTFRGCLLLCEFLYFCYSLYKLALSALTGSGAGDSMGDGND